MAIPKLPALPYVRSGLTEGLSANAAYSRYQEEAHSNGFVGSRRQDFLRLYSQTSRLRAQGPEAIDAPKDIIHGGLAPVGRDSVRYSGYVYHVSVMQRSRGEADFIQSPYWIGSTEPMTPEEAEARALDYIAQNAQEYDRTTLGVVFTGVELLTPSRTL